MLKKIIKKIFSKGYGAKKFWDDWAEDFVKDSWQRQIHPQHKWLLSIIKKENSKSILEVGCGFGRNINFLIGNGIAPSAITAFDISSSMIKMARKYVKSKKIKLFVSDLAGFKTNEKFDLVFTHGVLMHIPKDQVESAISKLIDLSKKNIILIEQNYKADNNYTFIHDYKKLLSKGKLDIIEYRSDKKLGLDLIYAEVR